MAVFELFFACEQNLTYDFGDGAVPAYRVGTVGDYKWVAKDDGQHVVVGQITSPDRDIVHFVTQNLTLYRWARQQPQFIARTYTENAAIACLDLYQLCVDNSIAIPPVLMARLKTLNQYFVVHYWDGDEVKTATLNWWNNNGRPEIYQLIGCHQYISATPMDVQ